MYKCLSILFFILNFRSAYAQTTYDTIQVHFELSQSSINETDKKLLNLLVSRGVITASTNLSVVGYADYLGSESKNLQLSETRASNVTDYLVSLGINRDLIKLSVGKGSVKRVEKDSKGFPPDRRVDIVMESKKEETIKAPPPPPPVVEKPSVPPTPLANTRRGASFVLQNLYFNSNRHTVKPESLPVLDRLYEDLQANPNIKIQIEGHVCCVGNFGSSSSISFENTVMDALDDDIKVGAPYDENEPIKLRYRNNTLSRNRAKYIYEYLVKKGISPDRMKFIGYGNLRPVVSPERTKEDEARNRRVEIRILER